ncbi:hypothetical protein [Bradyrhizobium acaciae]|uniref:hypothetical protein n=1 Tax=Bradyrhizobium acaciae TaxID=2683706 RepID=UPI001E37BC98|nr:hypothetical protein [Bradyrhizobium acaciae]MCC8977448.1 hypothetical protein [Bradyrhizobium acaciae]
MHLVSRRDGGGCQALDGNAADRRAAADAQRGSANTADAFDKDIEPPTGVRGE